MADLSRSPADLDTFSPSPARRTYQYCEQNIGHGEVIAFGKLGVTQDKGWGTNGGRQL